MISIIVPYKNAGEWIRRCLESLHRMDDDRFEFLFIEDNEEKRRSLDFEIVEEYARKDDRFISLANIRNPGVSGARNTGLYYADGEWITFLDADDELLEDANRAYFATLLADANIHQMNHKRYYAETNRLVIRYTNAGGWYDIENRPTRWEFVWNKIYRRQFLEDNNIRFDESLTYGEDELFNLECLAVDNRIHHANIGVSAVIHHFENKNRLSRIKTAEDLLDHIRAIEDFILEQHDPTVRGAVCGIISDHWKSKTFMRLLGLQE